MYIKQLIIQGFKSYRDQTIVEPFSPKHNVIVGRNGSGKSNFFYAIQFVLSDEFSHLRTEQRQSLLHEGTGPRVLQAYVEVVFDNSDSRLPFDKVEVRLRRTIGAKKDQYYLDGKMVTKQEVQSMLESAGFSKSNPYYIVKQGKINELATAPDSHRLKLLREVAGTRVYDERKEESSQILRESQGKFDKILSFLSYIEERLTTLEQEKKELTEYQECDRTRRGLEHVIFEIELTDIRKKLDKLCEKRQNFNENSNRLHTELQETTDSIYNIRKRMRELEREWSTFEEERRQLAHEHEELTTEKTKIELALRDLKEEVDGERSGRRRAEEQLNELKAEIAAKQGRLDEIAPRFSELVKEEQTVNTELAISEQRLKELYSKQGWTEQFRTAEERDQWIKKNLARLSRQINEKKDQISRLRSELEQETSSLERVETLLIESTQELAQQRESIERDRRQQSDLKHKLDALQKTRTELWRSETQLSQLLQGAKDEISHTEASLRSLIPKSIVHGIDSLNKVINETQRSRHAESNLGDAYIGLLIDHFDTNPRFYTAVETAAGNKLFYHVVENDRVALKILEEFNRLKLPGEVNFFPLNRLQHRSYQYPDNQNVFPMINQLTFEDRIRPVIQQCFGKTLISRNMEVATQVARAEGMDCITLEGDKVSARGALTGGYHDKRYSRLDLQSQKMKQLKLLRDYESQLSQMREKLAQTESEFNSIMSDMQKLETKNGKMMDVYEKLQQDGNLLRDERQLLQQSKQPKERQLASLESTLQQLEAQKIRLSDDLGSNFLSQLTSEEQQTVEELTVKIQAMKEKAMTLFNERTKLETEKNQLENLLQKNLLRKREGLSSRLLEISMADRTHALEAQSSDLTITTQRITEINRRLTDLDAELDKYYTEKKSLTERLEHCLNREREVQDEIEEGAKEIEKMANKQSMLLRKKEESMRNIRDLGALPKDVFEKYQNLNPKQLFKLLEQCNNDLKRYENVNKKALDQFLSFTDRKEKLLKRKEELERSHRSIMDLMEVLDQRKYEAIQLTFKQVSKFFEDVFRELVPAGHGYLVMKTMEVNGEEASAPPIPLVDQFTGVGVKVSFSGTDETREMQQLSGGQKSLVALALIFAIQKCDPAPFYLFDEIDAALDANHRKRVAEMIHNLAENAQFITTTFRKELLESAVKFYGVRFRSKVSHIDCVTAEEALEFVEDDSTEA